MIPSTLPNMLNAQPLKQSNTLPVDENMLSKAVESKRNAEPGQRAEQPINNAIASNASLLTALQKRASQLMAEAEALVQRIAFATNDQIPELAKKLKKIANDLKQIASRHKAIKPNSTPPPTVNISAVGLSISSSSQAIPASNPTISTQALSNQAAATTATQAVGVAKIQSKAINSYESVERTLALDEPDEANATNKQTNATDARNSDAESKSSDDGLEGAIKKIQELLKLAAELLEKRIRDITDSEERKNTEENLRDAKADISDIEQMIGASDFNARSDLKARSTESPRLSSVVQTYVSNVAVSSVTISVVDSSVSPATKSFTSKP